MSGLQTVYCICMLYARSPSKIVGAPALRRSKVLQDATPRSPLIATPCPLAPLPLRDQVSLTRALPSCCVPQVLSYYMHHYAVHFMAAPASRAFATIPQVGTRAYRKAVGCTDLVCSRPVWCC